MVTVHEVRDCDPESWGTLCEELHTLATDMDEAADGLYHRGAGRLEKNWADAVGAKARDELEELAASYEIVGIQLRSARSMISGLELTFGACKRSIDEWLAVCERDGLSVDDEGRVTVPSDVEDPKAAQHTADEAEAALTTALKQAREADDTASTALKNIKLGELDADGDGDVDSEDLDKHRDETLEAGANAALESLRASIPTDGSAEEQLKWWANLTPEEREQYKRALPLELAEMEGLPPWERILLNESSLGYSRLALLEYVRDNWDNSDIDWEDKNSCTKFVSEALKHAGLDFKGVFPLQDDAWRDLGTPKLPFFGDKGRYSDSWGGADAQHDLFAESGSESVGIEGAQPGDVIYWTHDNGEGADGEEHHAAVVTAVLPNGDILYTQHTDSATNQSLQGRLPHNNVAEGNQEIQILRVKETW